VRDLLCHHSGLPRHDWIWLPGDLSPAQMLAAMRYLEPSDDIRSTHQYLNLGYLVASMLAERVSGQSWSEFTRARLTHKLHMNVTFTVEDLAPADRAIDFGHTGPSKEAIAKPAARAANDSSAITSTGSRGASLPSTAASCTTARVIRAGVTVVLLHCAEPIRRAHRHHTVLQMVGDYHQLMETDVAKRRQLVGEIEKKLAEDDAPVRRPRRCVRAAATEGADHDGQQHL
jgi:hypothetical protein